MGNTATTSTTSRRKNAEGSGADVGALSGLSVDTSSNDAGFADSYRSWKSSTGSTHSKSSGSDRQRSTVHSNLMRTQSRGRDPLSIYQVEEILGEGSMGSVSLVKKRATAVGGSSRKSFVRRHKKKTCIEHVNCFPALASAVQQMLPQHRTDKFVFDTSTVSFVEGGEDSKQEGANESSKGGSRSSKPSSKVLYHKSSSSLINYGNKRRHDTHYALKTIHLDRCLSPDLREELLNEVDILRELDHPNIVKAQETFEDIHGRLFLVLELCSGGDLYTRDPYKTEEARNIVSCILSAVTFLHDHNIVHRDLKYENIMFSSSKEDAEVKLIDFGLSQKFAKNEHLRDAVGTVYTMAPELLRGDYDAKVDVWSVGVIAYMLLSSAMPFYASDRVTLIKMIRKGRFKFAPAKRWRKLDVDAKIFVRDLLEMDPQKRPTAERALQLSWLQDDDDDDDAIDGMSNDNASTETCTSSRRSEQRLLDIATMEKVQASIEAFAGYSQLKKLALMVIAYKSDSSEMATLKRMFTKKFDKLHNGVISPEEFKQTLAEHFSYTEEEMDALFEGIDIDGTGTVHYCEFLAATIESLGSLDEVQLAEAFDRIDCDDTGFITASNLRDFLGEEIPPEYLDEIINEADIVQDHRICYEEFLALWDVESDEKRQVAKEKVHARLLSRDFSTISEAETLTTFEGDSSSTAGDERRPSPRSTSASEGGEFFFGKQKEMSGRGQWV